ncbi:MAG: hypothetical protein ACUVUD_00030 [bacterium]
MAYRGRDGQRHRQETNIPILNREHWYRVKMLVDLSGDDPYYAWWLNATLIWSEYDTSSGNDTLPPTQIHVGACWIDWWEGDYAGRAVATSLSFPTLPPGVYFITRRAEKSYAVKKVVLFD